MQVTLPARGGTGAKGLSQSCDSLMRSGRVTRDKGDSHDAVVVDQKLQEHRQALWIPTFVNGVETRCVDIAGNHALAGHLAPLGLAVVLGAVNVEQQITAVHLGR